MAKHTITLSFNRDTPNDIDTDNRSEYYTHTFNFDPTHQYLNIIMDKFELMLWALGYALEDRKLMLIDSNKTNEDNVT